MTESSAQFKLKAHIFTSQSRLLSTSWVYKLCWERSSHSRNHCKC